VIAVTAETVNPFQKLTQALLRAVVPAPFVSSAKQVYDDGGEGDGGGEGGGGGEGEGGDDGEGGGDGEGGSAGGGGGNAGGQHRDAVSSHWSHTMLSRSGVAPACVLESQRPLETKYVQLQ